MDPVSSSVLIDRPPAEVFEYLADVANHPEFMGDFTEDWHLTREDTYGLGAGVRFAFKVKRYKYPWVDATVVELQAPRRIALIGRGGKFNRVRSLIQYEVSPESGGCSVQVTYETIPKLPSDRLVEKRAFHKRGWAKALKRLREVMEDDRRRGERLSLAGGARKPATGYRFRAPDPAAQA